NYQPVLHRAGADRTTETADCSHPEADGASTGSVEKNTSLKPLQKIEQLKQIADSVDSKITPLLNSDQQQKFQAIRDEHRRELIEKMASGVVEKVGTDLKKVETDAEKAAAEILQRAKAEFE